MKICTYFLSILCLFMAFSSLSKANPSNNNSEKQTTISSSSQDEQRIAVVAYWQKGDQRLLEIVKGKKEISNGQAVRQNEVRANIRMSILEASQTGYVVQWQYESSDMVGAADGYTTTFNKQLNDVLKQITIVYRTDELGTFVELVNWQSIQSVALNVIGQAEVGIANNPTPEANDLRRVLGNLKASFATKRDIEKRLIGEILLFHTPYGNDYVTNELIEYDDEMPNLAGSGNAIPAKSTVIVHKVDSQQRTCEMVHTVISDPQRSQIAFGQVVSRMISEQQSPPQAVVAMPLQTNDTQTFKIDYDKGWTLALSRERKTKAPTLDRTDYTHIRILK